MTRSVWLVVLCSLGPVSAGPEDDLDAIAKSLREGNLDGVHRLRDAGSRGVCLVPLLPPIWGKAALEEDEKTTRAVTEALHAIGPEALAAWTRTHPEDAWATVKALALIQPSSARLFAGLFGDEREEILRMAAECAEAFPPATILPALCAQLDGQRPVNRAYAAYALVSLSELAPGAVRGRLPGLLSDESRLVRRKTLAATSQWLLPSTCDDAVVARLVALLKDEDPGTRRMAAESLGRAGAGARNASPALVGLLDESSIRTRIAALIALRTAGTAAAVPAVRATLADADVAPEGALTLLALAPDDEAKTQAHIALLDCFDDNVREGAVRWLKALGPLSDETRAKIRALLSRPNFMTRACVARALWNGGEDAQSVLRVLLRLMQDEEPVPVDHAPPTLLHELGTIEAMGPCAKMAEARLSELASTYEGPARVAVLRALKAVRQE